MGKTRDFFQENLRYQGDISCKDGHRKDRTGIDPTEAVDIKKRWQRIHRRTVHQRSSQPK